MSLNIYEPSMIVHRKVTLSITFTIYNPVFRGTVRVQCLAQEHVTMSSARARTQITRFGEESTNHEAIVPLAPRFTVSNL